VVGHRDVSVPAGGYDVLACDDGSLLRISEELARAAARWDTAPYLLRAARMHPWLTRARRGTSSCFSLPA